MHACNKITDLCDTLPYMKSIIQQFQPATRCRLYKLSPHSVIRDHIDDNFREYQLARLIIPIAINDQCVTIMEGLDRFHLKAGECWFLNDSKMHRVENNSDEDRVVMLVQTDGLMRVVKRL